MSISDKLTYLLGTKDAIKSAIVAKGVTISAGATFRSYATSIGQITGGGGEPTTGDYNVYFYDYYGKLSRISYVNSGEDATAPTLDDPDLDLTEWQGDSYTNVTSDRRCYAIGVTTDGKGHFDIELTPVTGLQPPLYFVNDDDSNSLFIDLGDGSSTIEITATGNVTHTPTYAEYGKYTIKVWKTAGTFGLGNGASSITVIGGSVQNYRSALTAVRGGNSVTSIGDGAFYSCYSLTSISIPNSVESIGNYAFKSCYSLTSISIPNSVTSIGNYAFNSCYSLTSISIPNSVESIGDGAFNSCYSLTSISIPNSVTSIGNYAFNSCYSLTSISIPNSVESIGDGAFNSCFSLTSISIPNSVESIGGSAFKSCYSLTSISIPNSVESIGGSAFYSCCSLTKYIIHATTPPTLADTNAFTEINSICKIYVPDASVTAYKNDTNWVTYADYIYPISEMED